MAVITQNYDIDLKATGEYPVVKMSQFDTGSRTIVFTVYDGRELAQIDGMVARVDGTRSDGVEFSSTCTVGTGSKVSFTISQEMTKYAGKHTAELVIFDADGNPIGTQNFIVEVEAATMRRDSAASADDRTLYDQYTDSVEQKFSKLSTSLTAKADALNKTAEDISGLVGASSKPITIYSGNVQLNGIDTIHVRLTYDPMTALVHAHADGSLSLSTRNDSQYSLCKIDSKYCPDKAFFDYSSGGGTGYYTISTDNTKCVISGDPSETSDFQRFYIEENGGVCTLRFYRSMLPDHVVSYELSLNAVWYARGGKYIGVTSIGTGGNTLKIGKTTTGAPGTQASVVNSGTAKDVVLNFTIPRGAGGSGSAGSDYTLPAASASTLGGVKIGEGINVSDDGTIDVQTLVDRISQMQSKYDALPSPATYEVGSGLNKGTWYDDYTWKFCRLRVVGGVCTLSFSATRKSGAWNAKAWERAHVLTLPDGLGSLGEVQTPIVTNGNAEPNNNTGVQIHGTEVAFRPTVDINYGSGTWFQCTVSWVAAGSYSSGGTIPAPGGGSYELPAATSTTLGGVKVGSGITVASDGTISVQASGTGGGSYTLPAASSTTLGGVKIGTGIHLAGDGTIDVQNLLNRVVNLEKRIYQFEKRLDALENDTTNK